MSPAHIELQAAAAIHPDGLPVTLLPEFRTEEAREPVEDDWLRVSRDPDLCLYRERTVAVLRRYFRYSIEVGRLLPSLLGREFFRTRVTNYRTSTFEDAVIFVHDVEHCLEKLDDFERTLIGRIVLQDFSQDETARLMGCRRRTVGRRLPDALDHVSQVFLESKLLEQLPAKTSPEEKCCQGAKIDENALSRWEDRK